MTAAAPAPAAQPERALPWIALPRLLKEFLGLPRAESHGRRLPWALMGVAALLEMTGVGLFTPILGLLLRQAAGMPGAASVPHRWERFLPLKADPVWLLGLVVLAFLLRGLILAFDWHVATRTASSITAEFRRSVLGSLLGSRWSHLAGESPGRVAHVLTTEAERVGDGYMFAHRITLGLLQVMLYMGLAVALAWQLGLLVLLGAFLSAGALRPFLERVRRDGDAAFRALRSLSGETTDVLASMKPLKAMGAEGWLGGRLLARIAESMRLFRLIERHRTFVRLTLEALQVCAAVGVVYVGVVYWKHAPEALLVSLALLVRAIGRLTALQLDTGELLRLSGVLAHLRAMIENGTIAAETTGGVAPPALERGIELRSVSLELGGREILNAAGLTLPPRGLVCVVGASGAGKTSLLDLLAGLLEPSSGDVLVDGVRLRDIDLGAWRRGIGYVSQTSLLLRDSLLGNVTLGDPAFPRAAAREALAAAGALEFVDAREGGLDADAGEQGGRLSGGQRQRIALARALVRAPRILLLDEVTAGLDPVTEQAVVETVRAAARDRLVLVATHSEALTAHADQVVEVAGGLLTSRAVR